MLASPKMKRHLVGWILAATVGLPSPAVRADDYLVDRIAAVVGSKPILLSTVRRRARPYLDTMQRSVTDLGERLIAAAKIYRDLLGRLVDEQLVAEAARQAGVAVEPADIDRALEQVARQNGLTRAELLAAVGRQVGMTAAEYREEIRAQLLEGKMLAELARQQGALIREEELRALYAEVHGPQPGADAPSFEAARPELLARLQQQRLEKVRAAWLERLRQETYVEIRLTP